jgi:hypothetical protein
VVCVFRMVPTFSLSYNILFTCQKDSCSIIFQLSTTNCTYIFQFCAVGRLGTSMFKRVLSDIIMLFFFILCLCSESRMEFFIVTKIDNKTHAPSVPEYMHKKCNTSVFCYYISPSNVYTTLM